MAAPRDAARLEELRGEIAAFVKSLRHPIVVEEEVELFDLTAADWRLTVEFGKLLFSAWNPARSLTRRVEDIAYRDRGRLGVFARKPGGRETGTLEIRELAPAARAAHALGRDGYRRALLAMLAREYSGWTFERVSTRSDREHSLSAWYTRGCARQGRSAWAFLGLGSDETPAASDALLAFGLIWLDWLRSRSERVVVPGLKVFLPASATETLAHRAAYLDHRAVELELFAWQPGETRPTKVDWRDYGNVETRLAPRRAGEELLKRHGELLRKLLGDCLPRVDAIPDSTGSVLSLRVLGLEVARIEGHLAPRVYFGLEGQVRKLDENHPEEFREFVARALEIRRAGSTEPDSDFYRLQSERWLESLLIRDVTKVDPALSPAYVYLQVPAFAGSDRGVLDVLLAMRHGRLAVMELKVQEEINLPLQALDYWLRVKWLQERGQFQQFGYFPQTELAPRAPRLYLVSPAFRFHSTTDRLLRYFDPSIEVVKVGINESWRKGLRVLFRRESRAPAGEL
ncbi:MAG: hypothetical protein LAP13_26010 [Acidobacteriia bacterium]|nr:hypothetical protein [Terriglobia bacterium]